MNTRIAKKVMRVESSIAIERYKMRTLLTAVRVELRRRVRHHLPGIIRTYRRAAQRYEQELAEPVLLANPDCRICSTELGIPADLEQTMRKMREDIARAVGIPPRLLHGLPPEPPPLPWDGGDAPSLGEAPP